MKKNIFVILIGILATVFCLTVKTQAAGSISVSITGNKTSATISASVSGVDQAIDNVTFYVDDSAKGQTKTSPYSIKWDTSGTDVSKSHEVKAKAFLADGTMVATGATTVKFDETGNIGQENSSTPVENFEEIAHDPALQKKTNISGNLEEFLTSFFARIINWILIFAGILAVAAVAYSGYMYVSSFGNAEQNEKAKKNLTWAIIGTLIIVLTYSIIQIVKQVITTKP